MHGNPGDPHHRQGCRHGQQHGKTHDQARAKPHENQQGHEHDAQRGNHVPGEIADGGVDDLALVVKLVEQHARGAGGLEFAEPRFHRLAELHHI